jgi:hypothetical protein
MLLNSMRVKSPYITLPLLFNYLPVSQHLYGKILICLLMEGAPFAHNQ